MTDLTLCICVYNAGAYLKKTLESVVTQTMKDFHLLIIDDCSTDASVAIAEEYLKGCGQDFELVRMKANKGIGHARYYAERHSNTRYMMFLDADDILYPDAIAKMYQKITSDEDLMAVGCYLEYIDEEGKKIGGGIYLGCKSKEEFREKASAQKLIFMQPTAIYDRLLSLSVGGYDIEGYPSGPPRYQDYCEDLDLWTRMSDLYADGKAIVVLPEILCQYRKAGGLSSSSYNMILKMRFVKSNLKLRRSGHSQLSFTDFLARLSDSEQKRIRRDANAADTLRNGVMYLRRHETAKGIYNILRSIAYRPGYLFEKVRHNLLRR